MAKPALCFAISVHCSSVYSVSGCYIFVLFQGTIATGLSQPVDVMKTRLMNAEPGQYKV